MQNASTAYQKSMKGIGRNRGYIKATIGVINSTAQKNVRLDNQTAVTYFSNTAKPFNNYKVSKVYATGEQDFSHVDGTMYFLPPDGGGATYYNNGVVTEELLGAVYISFGTQTGLDIKGLMIEFGECYPVDFTIENDSTTYTYTDNDQSSWTTEDVFDGTSYIIIRVTKMSNGQGRLRIHEFYCGIVNAFSNEEIKSYTGKEYVSSITESIPSNDVTLTVDNQDQYYNADNAASTLAYMEVGQEVNVWFGYDVLGDGEIEWLPAQTTYLKTWSATDTEAKFTATDRFDYLSGDYIKGQYSADGISLYDLAVAVLTEAGITDSREYFIDPYLETVLVHNPLPVTTYSEALQIIANAGRCALFEDRNSRIHMQSSFIPDMTAASNGETAYSHVANVLNGEAKDAYAIHSSDFSVVDGSMHFMTEDSTAYLNTGYVSDETADSDGLFTTTPFITITLEAGYISYGMSISFRNVAPQEFQVITYYDGEQVASETFTISDYTETEWSTNTMFERFDTMEIVFTKGHPNSRITIDNIVIGEPTDYVLERNDMTDSPTTTRADKLKSISVVRTVYSESAETAAEELATEDITVSADANTYTVEFSNASYGLTAEVTAVTDTSGNELSDTVTVEITESGSYYALLTFSGVTQECIVTCAISGYEYQTRTVNYTVSHATTGEEITWENPLISTVAQAADLQEWLASYYLGDVDYSIPWRGDPRVDANDLMYLQLKTGEEATIRVYQNELKFSGAWSGTIKARKAVL